MYCRRGDDRITSDAQRDAHESVISASNPAALLSKERMKFRVLLRRMTLMTAQVHVSDQRIALDIAHAKNLHGAI
jgi:hypothetical protein